MRRRQDLRSLLESSEPANGAGQLCRHQGREAGKDGTPRRTGGRRGRLCSPRYH